MARFAKSFPSSLHPLTLLWAAVLGAVSGASAASLRFGFRGLQWLFTHSAGSLANVAAGLSPWRRVLTPVAGACVAMAILALQRFLEGRKAKPYTEYVVAVRQEHGRILLAPNLWRTASSSFSVATGAAIGREGTMIQFSGAVTSAMVRWVCRHKPKLELFPTSLGVACGVAGGVAVAYSAPVAGVFFAAEIALGGLRGNELLPLAFASVAGWLTSRAMLGGGALYPVRLSFAMHWLDVLWLVLLAVGLGAIGPLYQYMVRMFSSARKLPFAFAWGGAVVGGLSLLDPRVWGNGDAGLNVALGLAHTPGVVYTASAVGILLGLRLLATSACVGVGTVGGVFTPTLFAGAAVGFTAGRVLHTSDPVIFAVLGMCCLIAAATHAPLMAAFMATELIGDWRGLPMLLAGSLIAWQMARRVSKESLYAIATQVSAMRASGVSEIRDF